MNKIHGENENVEIRKKMYATRCMEQNINVLSKDIKLYGYIDWHSFNIFRDMYFEPMYIELGSCHGSSRFLCVFG